jgi:hypothetical protein
MPSGWLSPDECAAHDVEFGSDPNLRTQGDHSRDVCVHHADCGRRIKTPRQKHAAGIQERLPGCPADYFAALLETSIEAIMLALAPSIKCWRDDDSDMCHPALTLRDDDFDRAQSAGAVGEGFSP